MDLYVNGGPEAESLRLLEPTLTLNLHEGRRAGRSWFRRTPDQAWVAGADIRGPRAGTILFAPTADTLARIAREYPGASIIDMASLDPQLTGERTSGVRSLPRLVPDMFFPPGDGADPFRVTRRLHLEERPRVIYVGRYDQGAALSTLFSVVRRLFTRGGELVLWEGISHRAALAPVVKSLRLTETVVFAPPLTPSEAAGLFLGADAIWVGPFDRHISVILTWAMASGTPLVAPYTPDLEAVLGPAALWTYEDGVDIGEEALLTALQNVVIREALQERQTAITYPWHVTRATSAWRATLAEIEI